MAFLRTFIIAALALVTTASAQQTATSGVASGSSVTSSNPVATISVFGNFGALAGSLVGITSSLTTLALTCPVNPPPGQCLLLSSLTATAGSSTFAYTNTVSNYTIVQHCQITSGAGGTCSSTRIGRASDLVQSTATLPTDELASTITSSSVATYAASDITVVNVAITAGETAALTGVTPVPTSTPTSTSNDAKTLLPGVVGAGLLGLLAAAL